VCFSPAHHLMCSIREYLAPLLMRRTWTDATVLLAATAEIAIQQQQLLLLALPTSRHMASCYCSSRLSGQIQLDSS
jgi:hypothetical protein